MRQTAEGEMKAFRGEKCALGHRRSLWWCQKRNAQFSKPSFACFQDEAVLPATLQHFRNLLWFADREVVKGIFRLMILQMLSDVTLPP